MHGQFLSGVKFGPEEVILGKNLGIFTQIGIQACHDKDNLTMGRCLMLSHVHGVSGTRLVVRGLYTVYDSWVWACTST